MNVTVRFAALLSVGEALSSFSNTGHLLHY